MQVGPVREQRGDVDGYQRERQDQVLQPRRQRRDCG